MSGPGSAEPPGATADAMLAFARARLDEEYDSADMLVVQGDWWHVDKNDPAIVRSTYFHVAARCDEGELAGAERRTWHIARYDPGRAKREVKAKRVTLAEHLPVESIYGLSCKRCVSWQDAPWADGNAETEFGIAIPDPWPCQPVRAVFAAWTDHRDYRRSWMPETA